MSEPIGFEDIYLWAVAQDESLPSRTQLQQAYINAHPLKAHPPLVTAEDVWLETYRALNPSAPAARPVRITDYITRRLCQQEAERRNTKPDDAWIERCRSRYYNETKRMNETHPEFMVRIIREEFFCDNKEPSDA